MKKPIDKLSLLALLSTMLTINTNAFAKECSLTDSGLYAKLELGAAIPAKKVQTDDDKGYYSSKKLDTSFSYGGGIGYKITDKIRVDAMFSGFDDFKQSKNPVPNVAFITTDGTDIDITPGIANSKFKVKTTLLMANAYYDIANLNGFIPYLTAGVGLARNKSDPYKLTLNNDKDIHFRFRGKSKNNFAYGVGAGLGYQINDKIRIDAQYKFLDLGKFEHNGIDYYQASNKVASEANLPLRSKFRTHNLTASLSYSF